MSDKELDEMSLSKRIYEQQQLADAPKTQLANINHLITLAYRAAYNEPPNYETLGTIARPPHEARQKLNALTASVAVPERVTL